MPEIAQDIYRALKRHFNVFYDEKGAVGRRYRARTRPALRSASPWTARRCRTRPSPSATATRLSSGASSWTTASRKSGNGYRSERHHLGPRRSRHIAARVPTVVGCADSPRDKLQSSTRVDDEALQPTPECSPSTGKPVPPDWDELARWSIVRAVHCTPTSCSHRTMTACSQIAYNHIPSSPWGIAKWISQGLAPRASRSVETVPGTAGPSANSSYGTAVVIRRQGSSKTPHSRARSH